MCKIVYRVDVCMSGETLASDMYCYMMLTRCLPEAIVLATAPRCSLSLGNFT